MLQTFLFTDIEGSSRLWEAHPERMTAAVARHDALTRAAVAEHGGRVVKMAGDGVHAVFASPADGVAATLALQCALADPAATDGLALKLRCGLHTGDAEERDGDWFGSTVNRAARIAHAAHGGQVLLSVAVRDLAGDALPAGAGLRDLGAVRLRDLADAQHLFQLTHPALRADFPPLRSLEATPNNLPLQLTSFIGREATLEALRAALGRTRLLTLVGAGGLGKTRLSLQAAAELLDDYADGVWLIELAPLTEDWRVTQALAGVLGLQEEPDTPLVDTLAAFAAERTMLVVLDNCEHLLAGCAELADRLLRAAPRLRILATSREPLRVAGETLFPLLPLPVPEGDAPVTPQALDRWVSTRLFLERARAARPDFAADAASAPLVAEICRRLDGIPLAIELAAARTRALSVQAIAERLDDRFRLLKGGDRTALPRQKTLHALIDWSHELLGTPERMLLRRLAVFAGGWTLDAAEAIAAAPVMAAVAPSAPPVTGEHDTALDVLEACSSLVEKSLVMVDDRAGQYRYRLLETVRQYALEQLAAAHEVEALRTRHLQHFLTQAEQARPQLVGPQRAQALARLDLEHDNLLHAHGWGGHDDDCAQLDLRLVSALKRYWSVRGLLGLAHRLTLEALARPQAQRDTLDRCRALFDAGQLASFMGHYQEARLFLEQSLAIARTLGDRQREAAALQPLALACLGLGEGDSARSHLQQALTLARTLGDQRELAAALNALAQVHRTDGELDAAEPLYRDVVAIGQDLGDRDTVAIGQLNLTMVQIDRGAASAAAATLDEVLATAQASGSQIIGQSALEVAAALAALEQRWATAAQLYGAAEANAARTGLRRDPTDEAFLTPRVQAAHGALGSRAFEGAEAAGRALDFAQALLAARASVSGARDARRAAFSRS